MRCILRTTPNVCVDMTKSSHRKPPDQVRAPGIQVVEATASSALDELVAIAGRRTTDARAATDAIVLEGLTKTYPDGTEAVRGISVRVAAGECFGILGPNGAGKSTTIGMLGTLIRPTGGHARVAGFDVVADPVEVRRRIGFAMQQAGVDEFASASELVILQGRLQGLAKREATTRARLLLRAMELERVADTRLAALSGGTKRRVDLAASLVHLPPILFLDEPTEGLDPRSRAGIWDTLDRLRRDLGVTVVLSTHYMDEGDRLCDRIAIIDRGTVVVEGAPAALKGKVGSDATLEDVYLHYTGRELEPTLVAA
jgi:ABC-2 type transport system ATP-binding protein